MPATRAHAVCNIIAVNSISPLIFSAGTYTPPTAPTATTLTLSINVTAQTNAAGGQCRGRVTFQRPTLPATMAITGGGTDTLPYTIRDSATGGNTIMITGGNPAANQRVGFFFTIPNSSTVTTTQTVTVYPILQPGTGQAFGSYSDTTLNVQVFNDPLGSLFNLVDSRPFTMTGLVRATCSITSPVNTSQVIGVSALGLTTGMTTAAPSFTVSCNNISDVTLASQNGAVTLGGVLEGALPTVPSFRNKIEYSASINGGAGTVTLNTASGSTVSGVFRTVTTSVTPSVTLTPETSSVPLVAGSYSDVLTVSIVPR